MSSFFGAKSMRECQSKLPAVCINVEYTRRIDGIIEYDVVQYY